ncbi:Vacuolar protein sorting-associated protein atg6 [Lecanora helva]
MESHFNPKPFKTMNCQKCRTPLALNDTLQDLNPAAFDLLVGSTGQSVDQAASNNPSRLPYPQERKELYDNASQNSSSPVFKRAIPAARYGFGSQPAMAASTKAGLKDNPAMSFVMLTESQVAQPQQSSNSEFDTSSNEDANVGNNSAKESYRQSFSHQLDSTTRLFELLSSRSDIDHPICTECTDLLLSQLQNRLTAATKERDAYISFLKNLNNSVPSPSDVSKAQASLAASKAAESKAFAELLALEKEKAALDDEVAVLEAESLALDQEEEAFWRSRNAFALELSSLQEERDAINAAYDHDSQQLERLQRTNVYNDTFCIGHDGFFGTINGLRLGRLPPPQNVDWSEINAAWGTAALLLATVAEKLRFSFRGYRIKPMGSTSKIERIEYPTSASKLSSSGKTANTTTNDSTPQQRQQQQQPKITPLDLFSSGDLPLGRMLLHRRLDAGMVAFLECLRQLGEHLEVTSSTPETSSSPAPPRKTGGTGRDSPAAGGASGLKLPYAIKKDKIGDASIKLGVSQDEAWTRACKYALTCCKFLLAHASNIASEERRRESPAG